MPQVLTVLLLLAGVPLFLRMPPWCDLTLYDMAARTIRAGGVHYRDVFDTNLPGFVWLLAGVRWLFGPGYLAVRAVDLAAVAGVVSLIDRLAKRGGATPAGRWWAVAGAAAFYPFTVEMCHAQRDTWMALPILAAVVLRVRRALPTPPAPFPKREGGASRRESPFVRGRAAHSLPSLLRGGVGGEVAAPALEGALWGAAVWLKPHAVLMAAAVWLLTARPLAASSPRPWRAVALDLLGNVAGGLAVGAAGVAWLVGTGTWPHFVNVMTEWNPQYTRLAWSELGLRTEQELFWFPPFSLWLLPTVPLAAFAVMNLAPWSGRPAEPEPPAASPAKLARGTLAGLWLVWAGQAFLIQRGFMYIHVPETLLMLGLWAALRVPLGGLVILWVALTSAAWLVADVSPPVRAALTRVATDTTTADTTAADLGEEKYLVRHPLADPNRLAAWPDCWRFPPPAGGEYALRDRLARIRGHEAAIGWAELGEVAEFLRAQGVRDREVIAWHDSPHAVYLMLGIEPGVRFMHVNTAQWIGDRAADEVQRELEEAFPRARFAVSDLERVALAETAGRRAALLGPPAGPDDLLPAALGPPHRDRFPFHQPAVFRSAGGRGRYVVHALRPPVGDGTIP